MAGDAQQQVIHEGQLVTPAARARPSRVSRRERDEATNAPFYRSIRFRLTVWYAAALIVVLITLSISLHTMLVRALTNDAETRLQNAAAEIADKIGVSLGASTDDVDAIDVQSLNLDSLELQPPSFDSILLSGLWFQVVGLDRQPYEFVSAGAVEQAPPDLRDALGDESVFNVEEETLHTVEVEGLKSLVLVTPLSLVVRGQDVGANAGWVVVGEPLGSRDKIIDVVDSILRVFGVVGVALAVWGGWLVAGRSLAPLGRMTSTAEVIANSDGAVSLSRRLEVPASGDELSQLALTFNGMLDRIETAFETQRRFVSDASHELRTPLTSVRGNVDVLLRQVRAKRPIAEDDLADVLGILQRESGRMSRLVDDMLALARSDAGGQGDLLKQDAVSLEVVVGEAMRTARQLARGQQLELEVIEPVTLYGDGDRLVQVVLIFLDNALRYTKAGGTVTVVVDRATDADEDIACGRITIRDTGCGIQPQHVPHLFERFFRVEDARTRTAGGTGLGLSIALSIVRGHGGWIDVDTAVGRGTTFTVWLPLEHPAEPTAELTGPEPPRVRRPARVFRHGLPKRRPLVQGRRKE